MDIATLFGLVFSLGALLYSIMLGGHLNAFMDPPAFLIVVVGTICVTTTSFSLGQITRAGSVIGKAFFHPHPNASEEAIRLLRMAQKSRQNGLLGIQKDALAEHDAFLRQGLILAVDGTPPEAIERIMRADTAAMLERHALGMGVLRRAGETSPAMGLVATLIGLVQMLGNLNNPSSIGPAMAVALLGTFYGAVMAYIIMMPLAAKLERASGDELIIRKLYTSAVLGIARQENPRQIELHINAVLSPTQRINVFRN